MTAKKTPATKKPAAKKAPGKKRATTARKAMPRLPELEPTQEQLAAIQAANQIVRESGLDLRRQLFVIEYAKDANGTQALIRCGFTGTTESASVLSSRLLGEVKVKGCIDAVMNDRIDRGLFDGDAVVAMWVSWSQADPNALTQFRRVACRYCHGKGHRYQFTPAELEDAKAEHEAKWVRAQAARKVKGLPAADTQDSPPPFDEKGGIGYKGNADPHPDCPECWGEGIGRPFFADTRKVPEKDRSLFAGVKQGKEGIEILMHDQKGALDSLARHHGVYRDKLAEAMAGTYTAEQLEGLFGANIGKARERQAAIERERGTGEDG